jgi:glycerol uptake facilitator-like aquaporin
MREAFIELVATAFLLIAVVGSGIMAERLCGGNLGLALLANAIATGGALVALILAFAAVGGPHEPRRDTGRRSDGGHALARRAGLHQIAGAILAWLAYVMFDLPIWQLSHNIRTDAAMGCRGDRRLRSAFGDLGLPCHREPVTGFAVAATSPGPTVYRFHRSPIRR